MHLAKVATLCCVSILFLGATRIPAAEIGLAGADPTIPLPTTTFGFTVDSQGFFTAEYTNISGFTFSTLLITGAADGINSVGCSPDSVFTACSANIDTAKDIVSFLFSGGPGIATNQSFFLTAQHFVPGQALFGTSTVATPEPATVVLTLAALGIGGALLRRRQTLKLRVACE